MVAAAGGGGRGAVRAVLDASDCIKAADVPSTPIPCPSLQAHRVCSPNCLAWRSSSSARSATKAAWAVPGATDPTSLSYISRSDTSKKHLSRMPAGMKNSAVKGTVLEERREAQRSERNRGASYKQTKEGLGG